MSQTWRHWSFENDSLATDIWRTSNLKIYHRLRHHWHIWDSLSSYFHSQGNGLTRKKWSDGKFFHPMHRLSYFHVTTSYHHVCRICRPNKSFSWKHSAWTTHWCISRFSEGIKPVFWRKYQYTLPRTVNRSLPNIRPKLWLRRCRYSKPDCWCWQQVSER